MLNFTCVCVGGGRGAGGYFYVVVFYIMLFFFSNSELNTRSVSYLEEYFHRQHFKREYFHIAYKR